MAHDILLHTQAKQVSQKRLLIVLIFLISTFLSNLGYEIYAFLHISTLSEVISEDELPRLKAVQETSQAILSARFAFGDALRIDKPSQLEEIKKLESSLKNSILIFEAYSSALTWGSESDAFKVSDGGLNFAEWKRLDLFQNLIIKPPSEKQQEYVGVAALYFGGFSSNAFRAIAEHKKFLRLVSEGRIVEAEKARVVSLEYLEKGKRYFELAFEPLSLMVEDANKSVLTNAQNIERTQRLVFYSIFILLTLGFFISVAAVLLYAKKNGELLDEIGEAGKLLTGKDQALVQSNNSLTQLNKELNETAKILIQRDLELTQANDRLLQIDTTKSEFVSVAAHQLRTPLTGIRWSYLALLEGKNSLDQAQRRILEMGLSSTMRSIELVNDLLNVARIEEGKFGFTLKRQPITPLIKKVEEHYKDSAEKKGVTLKTELPAEEPPELEIDGEKITMVLDLLVDNSIKYTPPGGTVIVRVVMENNTVQVDVEDTGVGIPEHQSGRIFNKFFRADNAMLLQTAGNGLGLYVAKNIVERHDGKIWFESAENKGTKFHFTLPFVVKEETTV